jgi:hypothetical protein
MGKRILKIFMCCLALLLLSPFFVVGAVITLFFAALVGVPLTAPGPPVTRYRMRPPAEPSIKRAVSKAEPGLLESASVS